MKHVKIDYTKLSNRIVEQVNESLQSYVLSEAETDQLIQAKFDRAKQYSEALKNSPAVF